MFFVFLFFGDEGEGGLGFGRWGWEVGEEGGREGGRGFGLRRVGGLGGWEVGDAIACFSGVDVGFAAWVWVLVVMIVGFGDGCRVGILHVLNLDIRGFD